MYMNQIGVPFGIYTPYCPTMATHTVSYSWTLVKTAGVNAPQTICTNVMTKDFSWTNLSAGMYSLTMNMIIQQTINGVTYSCTLTRTSQFGIGTGYFTTPPVLKTISGETLPSANWQVYPNPAIGILYISNVSNDGEQISNIQLFGVDGKELSIEYHKMDRNLLEVYLKDLPNGLYYLRMVTDINTYNRTIAIQK